MFKVIGIVTIVYLFFNAHEWMSSLSLWLEEVQRKRRSKS